jgi:hypothetical protein
MRRGFWPPAAARAVMVLALAATASAAFAQAGSVGGTIGNTDKSVSGGDERQPPHPIRAWIKPPAARQDHQDASQVVMKPFDIVAWP